jgi:uncharacterized protein (TIGR02001 family)
VRIERSDPVRIHIPALCLSIAVLTGTAGAAEPTPAQWGAFAAARIVSDYRFNGASNSNRNPALQGYVHVQHDTAGWYAGVFISEVDFADPGRTRGELDVYVGRAVHRGRMEYRAELMHLSFDEHVPGPTYDSWQGKMLARRYFGSSFGEFSVSHTPEAPYAGGPQTQLRLEGQYSIRPHLRLTTLLGRSVNRASANHTYGSIGLEADWRRLTLGIQWVGSDRNRAECLGTDWCKPALVGSLTLRSW